MSAVIFVNTRPTRSEAEPPFWAAARLGLDVVVLADVPPPVPASLIHDIVEVDTYDFDALRAAARDLAARHEVVGVVCWGDRDVEGVAQVAEELGLRGHPVHAAGLARDKAAARRALAAVAPHLAPRFAAIRSIDDVPGAMEAVGFPAVVKPAGASASKGIFAVRDEAELRSAAALLLDYTDPKNDPIFRRRRGQLVVEEFLTGGEHSVDGIVVDGKLVFATVTDKIVDPAFNLELQQVQPTALSPGREAACLDAAQAVADAMGLGTGAIHLELKVDGDQVRVIELNARTAGGYITTHIIALSRGVDILAETLAAVCGLRSIQPAPPATIHAGSRQHLADGVGTLRAVRGLDSVLGIPGVANVFMDGRIGQSVGQPPVDFTGSVICSVLAAAGSRAEVDAILLEADATIEVDVR
ncbi:hypothetical protein GCM10027062_35160 [Nocardioides hungaricus]